MRIQPHRERTTRLRRGVAIVEAAIVLPLVMMFLMGIMEYGRYVMTLQVLTNASREGARYAMSHTEPVTLNGKTYGNALSDVQAEVTQASAGIKLTGQSILVSGIDSGGNTVAWTSASAGEGVKVQIKGTYEFMIPKMLKLPSSMPMTAQATMRSEGN